MSKNADNPALTETPDEKTEGKGVLRGIAGIYRNAKEGAQRLTTETTTLTEYGTNLDEVADLIRTFEEEVANGRIPRSRASDAFSNWAQNKIRSSQPKAQRKTKPKVPRSGLAKVLWDWNSALSFPLSRLQRDIDAAKARIAASAIAAQIEALVSAVKEAIRDKLGGSRFTEITGLPTEDYLPQSEVGTFAEGMAEERIEAEDKKREKETEKTANTNCERAQSTNSNDNLSSGFKSVENYADHGIDGPTDTTEDGCKVIGPAQRELNKKTLSYVYTPPDEPQDPRKSDRCAGLRAELSKASTQFEDGHIKLASRTLGSLKGNLSQLENKDACPSVRRRIDRNIIKVARITGLLGDIKSSLTRCEPTKLGHQASILKKAKNRKLRAMYNRVARARPVANKYQAGKDAYWKGDVARSEILFREALRYAGATEKETCVDIMSRIGNNLGRIRRLRDFDNATKTAIQSCNMTRVASLITDLRGTKNPFLDKIYARLGKVPSDCLQRNGDASCRKTYGSQALAKLKDGKAANCVCKSGYRWHSDDDGKTNRCITTAHADKLAKTARDSNCRTKYGSGFYPATPDKDGSYYCKPTKKVASRWCNKKNKGSGWYAGTINSKGGYNCYRKSSGKVRSTRKRRKAAAPSRARSSARRSGRSTRCRTVRRQPNNDARAAAAAAAVILQGVQAYQNYKRTKRGRRSGGGGCSNPRAPGC